MTFEIKIKKLLKNDVRKKEHSIMAVRKRHLKITVKKKYA